MTRILIADDIAENRYLMVSLLKGSGYEVTEASNGLEALALAQASPPDMIITDVLMPVMDGFELCRRWKQDDRLRHIPFFVYTATYTDPKDERLALDLGADRYLVKPQTVEVLLEEVRKVLDEAARSSDARRSQTAGDELELLRQHKDALFRKLERKVRQLEEEIVQRDRAEAALRDSAGLLRIAGQMVRLGGWSVSLADRRVLWSDEVAAIHEMPPGCSPTLQEAFEFYSPEWRSRISEAFEACAASGVSYDEEMELVTAKGRRIWVRTIGEAIRDASGAIEKVQGAFQEITDRKQAEEERRKLQHQLWASQRIEAMGRLAGGVAHDFNNLLSVVLSYADFALETLREGDPLRADLLEIRKAGESGAALTRQLLAFSRKQILAPKVVSLNKMVAGVEGMLRRLLGEDINVEVHLAEELGSVLADPAQLEQVLLNLAVNARDAMPQGGTLTIETRNVELDEAYASQHVTVAPGKFVLLSVSDSGCGMPPSTREHIFEPFFTTKSIDEGTGLGLSIVYGIVKQSGGDIWVYSEEGQGTTFKVYLPQVDAPTADTAPRPGCVMATGSETVVVVEDAEAVRSIVQRILRRAGYRVHAAANGGEALLLCEKLEGDVDLLLTDVVMPRMSGQELSERLKETCPRLKTLYMSGYTDNAMVHKQVLTRGALFIAKPFSAADLTRKVREVLDT
ncbi:MAG: response regulator [Polyangia bacterium]|jgi:signal transduction histidine kinase/DNA-binding response OmpR family regulator|nr:response regulator [Polyangia bacterium]